MTELGIPVKSNSHARRGPLLNLDLYPRWGVSEAAGFVALLGVKVVFLLCRLQWND